MKVTFDLVKNEKIGDIPFDVPLLVVYNDLDSARHLADIHTAPKPYIRNFVGTLSKITKHYYVFAQEGNSEYYNVNRDFDIYFSKVEFDLDMSDMVFGKNT